MNDEIEKMILRLNESDWTTIEERLLTKRLRWFGENKEWIVEKLDGSPIERAYQLMLLKLDITEKEAPIVEKTSNRITLHSKNFCPVIGACDKLGLDTRIVCKKIFERPMEELLGKIDPRIRFSRNYESIRPHSPYCEEIISLE
jgi:hypothetical protein